MEKVLKYRNMTVKYDENVVSKKIIKQKRIAFVVSLTIIEILCMIAFILICSKFYDSISEIVATIIAAVVMFVFPLGLSFLIYDKVIYSDRLPHCYYFMNRMFNIDRVETMKMIDTNETVLLIQKSDSYTYNIYKIKEFINIIGGKVHYEDSSSGDKPIHITVDFVSDPNVAKVVVEDKEV